MNIFLHELKANRKTAIIWALALSAMVAMFLSLFPGFAKDVEASKKILENFPPAFRDAMGISLKNFFTIYGFYAYLFTFAILAGAIQAMNLSIGIFSKEDRNKTSDFLLSKPVSRSKVMASKLLASFVILFMTNIVFASVSLIAAKIVSTESFSTKTFVMLSSTFFLVQLMFLMIGTLFAVLVPKIKSVISVSLPVTFAFFILGMLDSIFGIEKIRYMTPFKFYDLTYIMNNSRYESKFLIVELLFLIVATIASFIIYLRKDIRAA